MLCKINKNLSCYMIFLKIQTFQITDRITRYLKVENPTVLSMSVCFVG